MNYVSGIYLKSYLHNSLIWSIDKNNISLYIIEKGFRVFAFTHQVV